MTALREEVARAIAHAMVGGHLEDSLDLSETLAIADAVIPIILGRAAEVAEQAAERCKKLAATHHDYTARYHNDCRELEAREIAAAIRQIGRGE